MARHSHSILIFFSMVLTPMVLSACEGPVGPQGALGESGPQGNNGPQGVPGPNAIEVVSRTIEPADVIGIDAYSAQVILIDIPEIDAHVYENGTVDVYVESENGWNALPNEIVLRSFSGSTVYRWIIHVAYSYRPGTVIIQYSAGETTRLQTHRIPTGRLKIVIIR